MVTTSSRLTGVNEVLRLSGYSTISKLGESRASVVAEDQLASAVRDLMTKGWWFNRARYTPTMTPLGWAHLPERYELDEGENNSKVAIRDGRRLYDRDNRTYVWGTDASVLADEADLSTANWTLTGATISSAKKSIPTPGGGPNDAQRLTTTAASGQVEQQIASASFVNGTRYQAGVYVGANASDVFDGSTSTMLVQGVAVAFQSGLDFTFEADKQNLLGLPGAARDLGSGETQEFFSVSGPDGHTEPEWRLASVEFVYASSGGDIKFIHRASSPAGSMLLWRPYVTPVGDFPLGELKVIEVLEYEDVPAVAQRWLIRRAAVEVSNILSADRPVRQHAAVREVEAYSALQRAEAQENSSSMLVRSPGVARTVGRQHGPAALGSLYGQPARAEDV